MIPTTYENDFYQWLQNQAALLKSREFSKLDIENLVEEIETLGRSEKRGLENYLTILLVYLLKVKYQPDKKTRFWDLSIKKAKFKIDSRLKESPSLKHFLPELLQEAYRTARLNAAAETGLDEEIFPENCPWKLDELIT